MTIPVKLHFLAATVAAAALLSACTADGGNRGEAPDTDGTLRFTVSEHSSASTRSVPFTTTDQVFPYSEVFAVYAYHGTDTLIDGEEVKWRGWFWSTEENHYWPKDGSAVDIYGVYPGSVPVSAEVSGSSTLTTIDYSVESDLSRQTDLLVTKAVNATEPPVRDVGVALDFRHAMSRISFEGRLSDEFEGWTVEVSGIRLCNIYAQGTFDYATMTWRDCSANSDYPVGLLTDDDGNVVITSLQPSAMTASDGAPMLIAQQHTPWDPATESIDGTSPSLNGEAQKPKTTGSYIAVDLHISRDIDGHRDMLGTAAEHVTAYAPITPNWQPGKHYTYTLIFGGGYDPRGEHWLVNLETTTEIRDWGEGTAKTVETLPN